MSYRYLEHKTDVFIDVIANTLEEALITSAYATIETMLDRKNVKNIMKKIIKVRGVDLYQLLYNWLEEITILTITDCFAINNLTIQIKKNTNYFICATIYGEKLQIQKHNFKLEIKSPTFHLMSITCNDKVNIRFILDI
ncbi:MAG: archease [Thaumarchaeota archaeon]|nr:archease [Nitrososphaerota archaeon]MCY3976419.1 archease [Nitrososphaerota archaeon]